MKKFALICSLIIAACGSQSCSDMEEVTINQGSVYYYQAAQTSNKFAMDGLSIAMRLAIFLEELKAENIDFPANTNSFDQGIYDKIGTIVYKWDYEEYNKMIFLLGDDDAENSSEDNYCYVTVQHGDDDTYTITYGGVETNNTEGLYTSALYDNNYRLGGYVINTHGVDLRNTNSSVSWSVSLLDDSSTGAKAPIYYSFTAGSYDGYVDCNNYSMKLYFDDNSSNVITYAGASDMREYNTYNSYGTWASEGTLTIVDYDKTNPLTMANTINQQVQLNITKSQGTSLANVKYVHYTTSPLIMKISESPHGYYGGVEEVYPYSNPSDKAIITSSSPGVQLVTYNGTVEVL